ncbi:MAG: metal-dependent transcriptional regulator [Candidatus Woesearchaeota archaeon]|nr:metal-dependent transcriptional regulator [Candidatus Woesearchaeota archaeon]
MHADQKNKISKEMYLKEIYLLRDQDPKPMDLIRKMKVSKSSVSEMLKKLAEEGVIRYESFGTITLTDKGIMEAMNVLRKYLVIKKFLKDTLMLPEEQLHEEACNLEHAFSDASIARLNIFNLGKEKHRN